MKIAVIGAGSYGLALGNVLIANGYEVSYFDPKIECDEFEVVIQGAEYVLLAVPAAALPKVLPKLSKEVPIIITSKGIFDDKIFSEFKKWIVLSGAGFSSDFEERLPVSLTVTDKKVSELLKADFISFDYTSDKKGVLMCGALKNIYAILAGFWQLERDSNDWKTFLELALSEMSEILRYNDADPETVKLACGVDDVKLSLGFPSRNYEYGFNHSKDRDYQPQYLVEGLTGLSKIRNGEIIIPNSAFLVELLSSDDWPDKMPSFNELCVKDNLSKESLDASK